MSDNNAAVRLVAIRQHVEEGSSRIALFRHLIGQMASRGDDTALGERLLVTMESALATLEEIWRANGGVPDAANAQSMRSPPTEERRHGLADASLDAPAAHELSRDGMPTLALGTRQPQGIAAHPQAWQPTERVISADSRNHRPTAASVP